MERFHTGPGLAMRSGLLVIWMSGGNASPIQLTDNSDSGKLCGAAAVSPSPLMTASPTPYHTTPLSRFSGPVWNLSICTYECFRERPPISS
ncbi:hypothetical protein J6590_059349 [Homalodisca vitripennis]|nr:hypothetical protein J6590_059349 [Homalodisca vitripennis]